MSEQNKQETKQEKEESLNQDSNLDSTQNDSEQNESENNKGKMNFNKITGIGFFGGIFWSFIALVLSFFDFTQLGPTVLIERIPLGKWADGYLGVLFSIFIFGIISIIIAFIYFFIGRKFTGVLPGVFYGLLVWAVMFFVLGKIAFDLRPLKEYSSDTIVTSICLFILYGTFIAYSISFAFQEQKPYLRGYSK